MRSFLDLFRASSDRRTRAKTTKLIPEAEGLESRKLLARTSIVANWSGIFANPTGVDGPISGVGTSAVQFGTPLAPNTSPSSVSFVGQSFPTPIRVRNHHQNSGVQVGQFTVANTQLTTPALSGINLVLTISANVGQRSVSVPIQLDETPNDGSGTGADTIRLVGKPIIRLIRGFAVQIVGFGIPNPGGRPTLSRELTLDEGATTTVTLIGKLIRR